MQDAGCEIQDTRCEMGDVRYGTTAYRIAKDIPLRLKRLPLVRYAVAFVLRLSSFVHQ